MVEYASTLPMTSTLTGTSFCETVATTTGTGAPPSPRLPPFPESFAACVLLLVEPASARKATSARHVKDCLSALINIIYKAALNGDSEFTPKVDWASNWFLRLHRAGSYLQAYLSLRASGSDVFPAGSW